MGAIIGRLSFDSDEILVQGVLDRMLDASSRPLDRRELFSAPGIALGWCGVERHAECHEPVSAVGMNTRHTIRVVADATLTNAEELRAALHREGHRFFARTDQELIAHAYDRWGTGCFERLRGPFACALWDSGNRRLVLARDHVGINPLNFALLHGHGVVFASELRALLQDPGVPRDWCADGVDAYLALGYVPAPLTAFRRISKLEPAHFLIVEGRRLHVEEFWDLPAPSRQHAPRDIVRAVKSALTATVSRELKHHTQSGLLYSGGVASCALLASAPRTSGVPITVDTDQDPSELTRSDAAAAHLGRVRELETAARPLSALAGELTATAAEPVGDPSAVTFLAVCKAASRYCDDALTAHGADTLWDVHGRRGLLGRLASANTNIRAVTNADELWDGADRRSIYTRNFAWQVRETNPLFRHLERYDSRPAGDPLDRAAYVEARTVLPDNTLVLARHAAAATGLSLRYPFLDRQMVELAAATPASMKRHGRTGMFALRQLLAPALPAGLLPPVHHPARHEWLPGALSALVPEILLGPRFDGRGIVSRPALRQFWEEHQAERADHSRRLWALLMLEFWFRGSIDGDAAAEPLEYAVLVKAA